ncbi:von Willebrand factor type A domain-containing protein [Oribacterium sp. KHPX15]|uniref:vWA domain-containing protein n=1 Tax=Oribacterium sp. KHPX15 TaxID=1855342 RepID=UPI000897237E|nr:vWA domain-containing protein [Oribacterium sp. KHPX15]SEA73081.1 von Willebrand factor type A domain-containing protein [Oribacterium sp. KHPX15]
MKKTNYSIKKIFRKGLATLLTASMVVTAVQAPAFAESAEEVTESSASVSGIIHKKITLELLSDDLKEAALTAIRENRLFDAEDYLGATGDNQKALKEYEAFFNENPGLYVVDAPESVQDTLSGEDAELRIFVQKDAKMATVDLTASPSEITKEDSTESKNVEFRYGTDKDIILYEPSSQVDTLVNGGEDAYYVDPEQEIADNSDYELTGNEKITFMFVNASDEKVTFTLKVDGVTYDKVEVGGRKAALQKIINEAGTKKSTEETTVAETTKEETTVAAEVSEETTTVEETTAAEVKDAETEAPAEETTTEVTEAAGTDAAEITTDTNDSSTVVEETAAETEKETEAAETESDVKVEAEAEETTEASEEPETEATIPEKIAEAVSDAFDGVGDVVLGRMTVYAGVVAEGVEFDPETEAPAAEDSGEEEEKETDGVVAEAVEAAAGEDTAAETDEVKSEEVTEAVEAADDSTTLENAVAEGISEDEAEDQVQETEAVETTVAETVAVAETEAPKEEIKKVDETKAAVKSESKKVASESEITEYDDFAKELIAEVKEEVLQDKEAAKENIKVARIAQYTINELGKVHYETEIDGYNVEVFALRTAFGDKTPELKVKKLYKPEEVADGSEKVLTDEEIAELKANNIYENSQSLDIYFVDSFGMEVEPEETVKVRITVNDEDLLKNIDASSLEVHHIKEEDSTLKTEKVASTEDVKALDENDEKISDEDLKADAEADAEGEEKEVNVASAVAEFEVNSFSTFTITWKQDNHTYATITVHYVDEKGKELDAVKSVQTLNIADGDVILSDVQGGVTDYDYVEARLGSIDGAVVATVNAANKIYSDSYKKVRFYDEYGKRVENGSVQGNELLEESETGTLSDKGEQLYYYQYTGYYYDLQYDEGFDAYYDGDSYDFAKVTERTSDNITMYTYAGQYYGTKYYKVYDLETRKRWSKEREYVNDVYLIYRKTENPIGGNSNLDPNALGAPAASKTLTPNDDGTYTLTLNVQGKSEGKKKDAKANVIIALDVSGSMIKDTDNKPNDRLVIAKEAINSLASKLFENNATISDSIEIGFITYSTSIKETSDKNYTNYTDFKQLVDSQTAEGGTNWEAALLAANKYDFNDDDPIYVIFVSDGKPTFRTNANGSTEDIEVLQDFNGGVYRVYGGGNYDPGNRCLAAAQIAAESLIGANKKLYAVNAFSNTDAESHMKSLFGEDETAKKNNYFNANDKKALTDAFDTICREITQDLSYANVSISDEVTHDTSTNIKTSASISGTPTGFEYDVYMTKTVIEDGKTKEVRVDSTADALWEAFKKTGADEDEGFLETYKDAQDLANALAVEKAELNKSENAASFVNGEVNWEIKGKEKITYKDKTTGADKVAYKLMNRATYSVSFVVWPSQDAYDAVADKSNSVATNYSDPNLKQDDEGNWTYKTNGDANLYYSVYYNNDGAVTTNEKDPVPLSTDKVMKLSGTNLGVDKIWQVDNIDEQKGLIDNHEQITLNLYKGTDKDAYISGIVVKPIADTVNTDNNIYKDEAKTELVGVKASYKDPEDGTTKQGIKWTNSQELAISPGTLVTKPSDPSKDPYKDLGKPQYTLGSKTYYMLEAGHDYHFDEKSENHKFELNTRTYHPMLVDGTLYDVTFGENNVIKSMEQMGSKGDEKITAYNKLEYDDLKVTKVYTGNMARTYDTTFRLHLFDESGNAKAYDEVVNLNKDGENEKLSKVTGDSNVGVYEFIIKPKNLNDIDSADASITLLLPKNVKYIVEEVKDGKLYSNYKTKWGTSSAEVTNECAPTGNAFTSKLKLDEFNEIYFVNENKIDTPTGFRDNVNPFVVLAIAGLAAMVFLAYDFQKRRLFED